MKTVIILRGVPGSGKSTFAKFLLDTHAVSYHCETDKYFYNEAGEYVFDPSKLAENHNKCFKQFCYYLENDNKNIVVSNCNLQKWEFERYEKAAKDAGFNVFVLALNGGFDNVHGVPLQKIETLKKRFEW